MLSRSVSARLERFSESIQIYDSAWKNAVKRCIEGIGRLIDLTRC